MRSSVLGDVEPESQTACTAERGFFRGGVEAARSEGDLLFVETRYGADVTMPRHAHPWAYFCFVVEGGFYERDGARSHEYGPSTLIFRAPGADHADRFGHRPSRCLMVRLGPSWLRRMADMGPAPEGSTAFQRRRINWFASHLFDEFRRSPPLSALTMEGLTLAMLGEACRGQAREPGGVPPRWLGRIVEALHESGPVPPSLSSLAGEAGVHPAHMTRVFRHHIGCSIGEYARRLRIDRTFSF